jgi:hypothetical protein
MLRKQDACYARAEISRSIKGDVASMIVMVRVVPIAN